MEKWPKLRLKTTPDFYFDIFDESNLQKPKFFLASPILLQKVPWQSASSLKFDNLHYESQILIARRRTHTTFTNYFSFSVCASFVQQIEFLTTGKGNIPKEIQLESTNANRDELASRAPSNVLKGTIFVAKNWVYKTSWGEGSIFVLIWFGHANKAWSSRARARACVLD